MISIVSFLLWYMSLEFSSNLPAFLCLQSQAVKTPTAIYLSGQIPITADGKSVEGSIAEKTRQCITNLKAVLTEAGSSIEKVVKVTIFLADMDYFAVRENPPYDPAFHLVSSR